MARGGVPAPGDRRSGDHVGCAFGQAREAELNSEQPAVAADPCPGSGPAGWTEPGAYEVAPGVHRIPLPLPNDGLRAVNVYVLQSDDGLTLVDGGWALAPAREALGRGLRALGAEIGDIRRFLVTHMHRDHYTMAILLRQETGAVVCLGRGEEPSLQATRDPDWQHVATEAERLRALGAEQLADDLAAFGGGDLDRSVWQLPDEWLQEGDITLPGGRVLEALSTPGHTAGHMVFHDHAHGLLFAGDHVLPRITPSIGLEPVQQAAPLASYLRSLALVRSRPDARLLPAHGPVADSVHARADELIEHHAQRLERTLEAVAAGDGSAFQVAGDLRWTRHLRGLDELDIFNKMLAVFETQLHLDLLCTQGRLAKVTEHGTVRYRI